MKLQDAFVAESGAYYGNFDKIGYQAPGQNGSTSNFTYADPKTDYSDGTASLTPSNVDTWQATNKIKLNDCVGNAANWKLGVSQAASSTQGQYKWTATVGSNCDVLTPNFNNFNN